MALDVDYLVVGAGASGLAFADALVDHSDATVAIVDRRDAVGGHWRDAYPFVRLHQASRFYGVASTLLGGGRLQSDGPERGLHERATGAEVREYYEGPVLDRLLATGRVTFLPRTEHRGDGFLLDLETRREDAVRPGCRLVDATYLSPAIPACTPPPFAVADDARAIPVGALPEAAAERFMVVGSGKTATDAIVWLLGQGTDPDAITWVRPRDPWMLDRASLQPDPLAITAFAAATMECAAAAASLEDLFLRLEEAGVMIRVDPSVTPSMAKTPTLGRWELELLRSVERVIRRGHVRRVEGDRALLDRGEVRLERGTVVVHCAADGLPRPDLVPIWGSAITLQPIRAGFPCFGAALAGYVEATRESDRDKNRLCPPSGYGNTLADWADMTARGARASMSFTSEPDIRAWVNTVALNPAQVPSGLPRDDALEAARERLRRAGPAGVTRLEALAAA